MTYLDQLVYDALYGPIGISNRRNAHGEVKKTKPADQHTNEAYVFTRVIPGVRREDVKVSCEGNTLRVETKSSTAPQWAAGYANTSWAFLLGDDADIQHTDAKLVDGILTVTVPRAKPVRTVHNVTVN